QYARIHSDLHVSTNVAAHRGRISRTYRCLTAASSPRLITQRVRSVVEQHPRESHRGRPHPEPPRYQTDPYTHHRPEYVLPHCQHPPSPMTTTHAHHQITLPWPGHDHTW